MLRVRSLLALALATFLLGCGKKTPPPAPSDAVAAQVAPLETPPPPPPPTPETSKPAEAVDTTSKVSILCYHQFTTNRLEHSDMVLFADDFRKQMQTLKDNIIPVIPFADFLAWRRGEKNIPRFSVILTIDDGYVSTHQLALPILKEFGYPFTVYLYTKFLAGGGKTMKIEQVKELLAAGGELGSHSVSHSNLRNPKNARRGQTHEDWLKEEIADSKRLLREKIGVDPATFAFPYGAYNEQALEIGKAANYAAMVTVAGRRVTWDTDLMKLGRYVVAGVNDRNFGLAIASQVPSGGPAEGNELSTGTAVAANANQDEPPKPSILVEPVDGATVTERQPKIQVDLSGLENVDPTSIKMVISGVGEVPAHYEETSKKLSYKPNQRLRLPDYWVQVTLRRKDQPRPDVIRWRFAIDASSGYVPAEWKPPSPQAEEAASP